MYSDLCADILKGIPQQESESEEDTASSKRDEDDGSDEESDHDGGDSAGADDAAQVIEVEPSSWKPRVGARVRGSEVQKPLQLTGFVKPKPPGQAQTSMQATRRSEAVQECVQATQEEVQAPEEVLPTVDGGVSVVVESVSILDGTQPSMTESVPTVDDIEAGVTKRVVIVEDTEPAVLESILIVNNIESDVPESVPMVVDTVLAVSESVPIVVDTQPTLPVLVPMEEEVVPLGEDSVLPVEEYMPQCEESVLMANETVVSGSAIVPMGEPGVLAEVDVGPHDAPSVPNTALAVQPLKYREPTPVLAVLAIPAVRGASSRTNVGAMQAPPVVALTQEQPIPAEGAVVPAMQPVLQTPPTASNGVAGAATSPTNMQRRLVIHNEAATGATLMKIVPEASRRVGPTPAPIDSLFTTPIQNTQVQHEHHTESMDDVNVVGADAVGEPALMGTKDLARWAVTPRARGPEVPADPSNDDGSGVPKTRRRSRGPLDIGSNDGKKMKAITQEEAVGGSAAPKMKDLAAVHGSPIGKAGPAAQRKPVSKKKGVKKKRL